MMRSLVAAAAFLVASSPAFAAEEKVKVAVLDMGAKGVTPELAASATALVASEMDRLGVFKVISGEDIRTMISFEKTKQSLGCEADASCLAEIGGALGVDYIVAGSLGKLGETYTLFLNLTDIKKAVVESRVQENIEGGDAKIIPAITRAVGQLVGKVLKDREGYLILSVSEQGATVKVDGAVKGVTPIRGRMTLAWGPHLVEVEKQGFVSFSEDVSVPAKAPVEKTVTLIPSMDFINGYESSNSKLRLGAWISTIVGSAAVLATGYFAYQVNSIGTDFDQKKTALAANEDPTLRAETEKLASDGNSAKLGVNISLVAALLGGVGATFFWIAGDDPDRYERFREASIPGEIRVAFAPLSGGAMTSLTLEF